MITIYDSTGAVVLEVEVDDDSYRYREIMGDHSLTLHYSLAEHVELGVGCWCEFQGARYTLMRPGQFTMRHSRQFEYTVVMESAQSQAKLWKFRNPVDGRLRFTLTAKPHEHLQMFVDNMLLRDPGGGWTAGECVEGVEKAISYDHASCLDALAQMASELETEYEFDGTAVHLRKVEHGKDSPLALSYGRGNGFKPGVGRANYGDLPPVDVLYVQGGEQNIDPTTYPPAGEPQARAASTGRLLLPRSTAVGYDGSHFSDQEGYDAANARQYVTDTLGLSVQRLDKARDTNVEESLDCSEIYPKREGEVTAVAVVNEEKNFYDFADATIPDDLDFADCIIEGETMTVVFQDGMLAGKEFEVAYHHTAIGGKAARRFEIVPQEIDGQTMPNDTFKPAVGDHYAVFNCTLPQSYITDPEQGAEWQMLRQAVRYLYDNEEQKFTFTGELDGIWARKDWENIGGKIRLGGYVLFTDGRFQPEGALVRITSIKDYVNKPHSPEIELSNNTVGGSLATTLQQIASTEVAMEGQYRNALQFTKRRFRDARETMEMLQGALLENFTESVSPVAVQTMQLLVGDESLQFRFVDGKSAPRQVAHSVTYDNSGKVLAAEAGIIQHMTLGITDLSSSHSAGEYRFWDIGAYQSAYLDDAAAKYYLYAKVERDGTAGEFLLSQSAVAMESVEGYYHLLVGLLGSEYDGARSFVTLYGFTEVLPGRVTTDRIVSGDGESWFDMSANSMKLGGALDFNSQGDGVLRLKGTLVQSQGGTEEPLGCYRGEWNAELVYYRGDEVAYAVGGCTSMFRYTSDKPGKGIVPTNTRYWQVVAQGVQGESGKDGTSFTTRGKAEAIYDTVADLEGAVSGIAILKYGSVYLVQEGRTAYRYGRPIEVTPVTPVAESTDTESDSTTDTDSTDSGVATTALSSNWAELTITTGDAYTIGTNLWVAGDDAWIDLGDLQGPQGEDGQDGADGTDGNFTELRYAKNGSTTTPPALDTTALSPSGWTTTQPTAGALEYLWLTTAVKTGDGSALVSEWATPVRITPYDGTDGEDGSSPALVYRGDYSSSATYYGTPTRVDCVKYNGSYYVARTDAGIGFSGIPPINSQYSGTKWNSFGAQFESVATQLLLAEMANIAGLIFKGGMLISQNGTINGTPSTDYGNADFVPNITIDGTTGEIFTGDGIVVDGAGLHLYNGSNTVAVKITNSSIGQEVDLAEDEADKTVELTESFGLSVSPALSTTTVMRQEVSIGNLIEGSTLNFGLDTLVLSMVLPRPANASTISYTDVTATLKVMRNGVAVRTYTTSPTTTLAAGNTVTAHITPPAADQQITISNAATNGYREGYYSLQVTVTITHRATGAAAESEASECNVTLNYHFSKEGFRKTLIGNDGLYSCWGNNLYFLASADGIKMRNGNYLLQVTASGIKKSTNGGLTFTNI